MKKTRLILVLLIGVGGITYAQTVTIGTQVWMTKNLDVATFRNGDPIPEAKTDEEWVKAGENQQPAWCYYKNDPANGVKYGKLYNWYAVNDSRGLAPVGYHIPSDAEWTKLTEFLGGKTFAGTKMKSKSGWKEDRNGTNECGFSGLPVGERYYHENVKSSGAFYSFGKEASWWSSDEGIDGRDVDSSVARNCNIGAFDIDVIIFSTSRGNGLSVRCLVGETGTTDSTGPQVPAGNGDGFTHWVGEIFGGGVVFHVFKDSLGVEHGLIVSLTDLSSGAPWGLNEWDVPNCESSNGATNTAAIMAAGVEAGSAAQLCDAYEAGGFTDWYLPSFSEFFLMINARYELNESLSQIAGGSPFDINGYPYYWSSTEIDYEFAYGFGYSNRFNDSDFISFKYNNNMVRAVRAF
jgi:uncharacterized protein (TIGR02145 family)